MHLAYETNFWATKMNLTVGALVATARAGAPGAGGNDGAARTYAHLRGRHATQGASSEQLAATKNAYEVT